MRYLIIFTLLLTACSPHRGRTKAEKASEINACEAACVSKYGQHYSFVDSFGSCFCQE